MPSKDAHSRLIERIDRAFDRAVGYEGGQEQTLQQREQEAADRRRKRKGKARAIVPDDEEEEEPMQEVAAVDPQSTSGGGGGFLPVPNQAGGSASAGGGFFTDDSFTRPTTGGGFMMDADDTGGEALPSFGGGGGGGGFLPMETDSNENTAFSGGGGGFFAEEPFSNPSNDPSTSLAPGGGGFFPSTSTGFDAYNSQGLDSTLSGGFLPQLPNLDFGGLDSLALPTPPRPARIPLSRVPGALRNLGVPRGSEREVMEMFEEVASEDENAEGGKSVRRERFIEALEVLLDDKEEEEEEEDQEGGDRDEEEYNDSPPSRRRSTRTTRRSTRANPIDDPVDEEEVPNELKETDFAELSSESEDSAEPSTEDDEDGNGKSKTFKTRKAKPTTKSKNKKTKYDPRSKISKDKIAAASDSFDLFFEGSPQLSLEQKNRKIGLAELQRACRVLKERFTDEDLTEMLEFAAEGNGLVDLESFARILVETGL